MPVYLYRREDGSTFEIRQKFSDDTLTVDPATGQSVIRVVQPAGIVFKGSGFYVTDSKGSRSSVATTGANGTGEGESKAESKVESKSDTKPEAKSEAKAETKKEAKAEPAPAKADVRAAAD
jgi:predicted nucleic acid-binding Zn ribbon protein